MKNIFCGLLCLFFFFQSFSQEHKHGLEFSRSPLNQNSANGTLSTGQSGTGSNIDVKFHKIFWRINPDSSVKYIRGYVQTNFVTIQPNVSSISFDLNAVLTVDSIRFRNHALAAGNITRSGNVLNISLGQTLANTVLDSITIFYQGTPPAVSGSAEGYQVATDGTSGQNYVYTLSESYEDRDWWPCKADMQDKIDSMEINVSVPWTGADTFWVASNGRLMDSTIVGNSRVFKYKSSYPIASYLVCVAVARYNRYYSKVRINNINIPVYYYLIRGKQAATYSNILTHMENVNQVVALFSDKFGYYPYPKDKHGFYEGLGGAGGMEHQTFSGISSGSLASYTVLCHELTHQWFGDKATFATWADLWLAEGFAEYGEALSGELDATVGINPVSVRSSAKPSAQSITNTPTRITTFANSNQVWSGSNSTAVYDRGCMVVSMLRMLSGDSLFFAALKNYLDPVTGSGYKSANTDSLRNDFNQVLDYDLTPFFNDFVYGVGHPNTTINWNTPAANTLTVSVAAQTTSAGATAAYFHNVIVLRVQGSLPTQDTLIVFYDIDGFNLAKAGNGIDAIATPGMLNYQLPFTPVTVTFDPYFQTLSNGTTVKQTLLATQVLDLYGKQQGGGNMLLLNVAGMLQQTAFYLQKSDDGVHFVDLGQMIHAASTGIQDQFYFKDQQGMKYPVLYYRVRYAGDDGKVQYSKLIRLFNQQLQTFRLLNNPASGMLNIQSSQANNGVQHGRVYDAGGKLMIADDLVFNGALAQLDIGHLPSGNYILMMYTNLNKKQAIRFVVK